MHSPLEAELILAARRADDLHRAAMHVPSVGAPRRAADLASAARVRLGRWLIAAGTRLACPEPRPSMQLRVLVRHR